MAEEKKDELSSQLFYPWFFGGELKSEIENYINGPINYLDPFKNELLRLYNEFNQPPEPNTIYILNIGANCYDDNDISCSHRELPDFILHSIKSDCKIKLLLVDNFKENYVPKTTKNYLFSPSEITKIDENNWDIANFINIKLFRTYFPSDYPTKKAFYPTSKQYQIIEELKNTSLDREFIKSFYSKLAEFVNNVCMIGSLFINISTASFKNDSVTESIDYEGKEGNEGSGNRNLELYPELLNLISPLTEKCFYLFVWPFESEYMQLYGTKLFVKYNDTEQIVINYSRELNKLVLLPFAKKLKIGSFKNTNKKHYQILFRNNEYVL